jgi:hypothetical protein
MSQTLEPRTRTWLIWEWHAALITIVGGAVLALAVTAFIHFSKPSPEQIAAANRARQAAFLKSVELVCTQAVATAKNFGIVPNYAAVMTRIPTATKIQGRYACISATTAARYVILADLMCRDFKNPHCVALYSVIQPDGTVLYRRQR